MRKFIVSDLHGDGNVYKSIMSYLDNIKKEEEIELYINGDLIDRGIDSASMLLDVKRRIEEGEKIIYLAGNHELMMMEVFEKRKKQIVVHPYERWFLNGGEKTDIGLFQLLNGDKDKILEVVDFVSNLSIYHKFKETINEKEIVLVHSACPIFVKDHCDLKLKEKNDSIEYALWTREDDPNVPFKCRIGHDSYFTIVGHTPNNNKYGVKYSIGGEYLNIDGGCSFYVTGSFEYDHVPLIEVFDNCLKNLTFNNNNKIIYGNYFMNNRFYPFTHEELNREREKLDHNFKPKKLIKVGKTLTQYEEI